MHGGARFRSIGEARRVDDSQGNAGDEAVQGAHYAQRLHRVERGEENHDRQGGGVRARSDRGITSKIGFP